MVDPAHRVSNPIGNVFNSEVGLFRTAEGGTARMIICTSQGEYLEAGLVRGEYAGYNRACVGDETGKKRYDEAFAKACNSRTLPSRRESAPADTAARTATSAMTSSTPSSAGAGRQSTSSTR